MPTKSGTIDKMARNQTQGLPFSNSNKMPGLPVKEDQGRPVAMPGLPADQPAKAGMPVKEEKKKVISSDQHKDKEQKSRVSFF